MRVLILGGAGAIGHYVERELAERGHELTVVHRGTRPVCPGTRAVLLDLNWMPKNVPAALREDYDVVVHMIAMTQKDADIATRLIAGRCDHVVVVSSCDVYLAYGRFIRTEPGPSQRAPIDESCALRTRRYPYRVPGRVGSFDDYDKIVVENAFRRAEGLTATVLRLAKVYGRETNRDFSTVLRFAHQPKWRWTHCYVENAGAAIAAASTDPRARGETYNIGEERTPTVEERLRLLPQMPRQVPDVEKDFSQDLHFSSDRLRRELDFNDPVTVADAISRTVS